MATTNTQKDPALLILKIPGFRFLLATLLIIGVTLGVIFLNANDILALRFAKENNLLENIQLVIILTSALLFFITGIRSHTPSRIIHWTMAVFMLAFAIRETDLRQLTDLTQWWFLSSFESEKTIMIFLQRFTTTILGCVFLLYSLLHIKYWKYIIQFKNIWFFWPWGVALVLALTGAYYEENGYVVWEEAFELVAYGVLLAMSAHCLYHVPRL